MEEFEELYSSVIELFDEFFRWKENNDFTNMGNFYFKSLDEEYKNIKINLNTQFQIEFLALPEEIIRNFLDELIKFANVYNLKIQFKYTFDCNESIKIYLHNTIGLSKHSIKNSFFLERNGTKSIYVDCINKKLAGKISETNVKYERFVLDIENYKIHGVAPKFEAYISFELSPDKRMEDDDTVMKDCTEKLRDKINNDPTLIETLHLTKRQLKLIKKGSPRIEGFTWHHDSRKIGKMDLVDRNIHSANKHTGGSAIWGGGKR